MVREEIRSQYDGYYGSVDLAEWRRLGAIDKVDNIRELWGKRPVDSLLDIGCGDGSIISRLSELEFARDYVGVDISRSAIAAASARNIAGASFDTFSGDALPFESESRDLVILSHVVEHLEHPRVLLQEAKRVGRRVIVEVPCEHTARLPTDYAPDPVGHINFYTPTTIRRLLQTCGFTVERQITRGCSLNVMRFGRRWSGIAQFAARELALKIAPSVAPAVFVYHTALLCH